MAGDNSSTNGERRASTADAQAAKPSMQAHTTTTMGPPPPPASNQSLASQKAPPSCQGSGKPPETTSDKGEPAKIAPTQIPDSSHDTYHSATQGTDTREDTDPLSPSEMSDPSERIEDFDWENHETRYHKKMDEFRNSENEIIDEFQSLCQYFNVWAQAGADHEVERSFKRMRTQTTLVHHHESELEDKRQHYIQVVNAFKSALQLLAK
ncbi:hypothetical protein LTR09_004725 [Extremus antarcticus]|uniref:Uncharacterized protein n=1 Tax=Extremus antarcticus TaxID=702011 RepID=A0AAJ0DQ08_9PEZI|nr:hypothetical protein LTR09_004725 [Extremus antarcticus]